MAHSIYRFTHKYSYIFIMAFSLSVVDVQKLKMFARVFSGTPPKTTIPPETGNVPTDKPGSPVPKSSIVPTFNIIKVFLQLKGSQ